MYDAHAGANRIYRNDEELREIIRRAIGPCSQIQLMPTGPAYIEATCHWPGRNAYLLLCSDTHRVIRFTDSRETDLPEGA